MEISGVKNNLCISDESSFWKVWLHANVLSSFSQNISAETNKYIKSKIEYTAVGKLTILCCHFLFLEVFTKTYKEINQGIDFINY